MDKAPVIETRDLTIRFGGNVAVNEVNLRFEEYRLKSIIGPNGAGKTTLFNLISGQYKPTFGEVMFKGQNISLPVLISGRQRLSDNQGIGIFEQLQPSADRLSIGFGDIPVSYGAVQDGIKSDEQKRL